MPESEQAQKKSLRKAEAVHSQVSSHNVFTPLARWRVLDMEHCGTIQCAKREYALGRRDAFPTSAHILSTRHQRNGTSRIQGIV